MRFRSAGGVVLGILAVLGTRAGGQPPGGDPKLADRTAVITAKVDGELAKLESLYKHLHTHPELSLQERETAARMARELSALGFEVTAGVGGTGVVAVLKNGAGPTVLVRTDLDALPVTEKTGVPYASTAPRRKKAGDDVGGMHA